MSAATLDTFTSAQSTQATSTTTRQLDTYSATSTTTSSSTNGNGTLNGTATGSANGSAQIQSPAVHYDTFQKNSHDLAMVFSQVPWMRFSIVAQPDIEQLAKNKTLKEFVHHVTSMTIATVSQQIHEDITKSVSEVIRHITRDVNERMVKVHAQILEEIISVTPQKTAMAYKHLGLPPYGQLLKDIGVKDCECPSVTTKPVVDKEPVVVAPGLPQEEKKPVVTGPEANPVTTSPETKKPVVTTPPAPAPPAVLKQSVVPAPTLASASWIWTPEFKTKPKPRVGTTRAFRRTIVTPSPVNALTISIAADDMYTLYVNGKLVGSGDFFPQPDRYTVKFEDTSRVVVAVLATQGDQEREI
ncbi:hypothetical protein CVT24_010106, partial [Panaeolus cyanescens]